MSEQITAYLAAAKRFNAAKKALTEIEQAVGAAYSALRNRWQRAKVGEIAGRPPADSVTISRKTWPTIDQISEVLAEIQQATDVVKAAWQAIPPADRVGLQETMIEYQH